MHHSPMPYASLAYATHASLAYALCISRLCMTHASLAYALCITRLCMTALILHGGRPSLAYA